VVVRNGIDFERFDAETRAPLSGPLPEGRRVAVIGNLWPVKGHRLLLEAVALLPAELREVHFVYAGDGPEREPLARRIEELGLSGRVHLLGHRLDVPALLARSEAACLCSSAEGLSNALMEAMAAGLPVVATRVGGNPELVQEGETGFLVPAGDARAMARSLARLLSRPAEARAMGARGRAFAQAQLSLERMAEANAALYRRVLACAPALEPSLRTA
jgi:glycosyltransferase involved in cell wall biosynthesis